MTSPLSVEQLFSGTSHVFAAAATSIARAWAPASRNGRQYPRTLMLATVSCLPFFSHEHWRGGHRALTQFHCRRDHGDAVVRTDFQPNVRRENAGGICLLFSL